MKPVQMLSSAADPLVSLRDRALSNLSFIRSAMERSGRFTAVPGWGGAFMGAGFGGLHIGFGAWIGVRHGG